MRKQKNRIEKKEESQGSAGNAQKVVIQTGTRYNCHNYHHTCAFDSHVQPHVIVLKFVKHEGLSNCCYIGVGYSPCMLFLLCMANLCGKSRNVHTVRA